LGAKRFRERKKRVDREETRLRELESSLQKLHFGSNMEKIGNKKNYPIPLDSLQDELEHAFVTQRANW